MNWRNTKEEDRQVDYMIQGSDEERCKHDGERDMFWHYDYEQAIMVQRIYCKICGKLIYTNLQKEVMPDGRQE